MWNAGTVPLLSFVSSQTQDPAGIVASLKDVTSSPVVTLVTVLPAVTTALPAFARSLWWKTLYVTEGVELPFAKTARILEMVKAALMYPMVMSSEELGFT